MYNNLNKIQSEIHSNDQRKLVRNRRCTSFTQINLHLEATRCSETPSPERKKGDTWNQDNFKKFYRRSVSHWTSKQSLLFPRRPC